MSNYKIKHTKKLLFYLFFLFPFIIILNFVINYNSNLLSNPPVFHIWINFFLMLILIIGIIQYAIYIINSIKNLNVVINNQSQNIYELKSLLDKISKDNNGLKIADPFAIKEERLLSQLKTIKKGSNMATEILVSISKEIELVAGLYWEPTEDNKLILNGAYAINHETQKEIDIEGIINQAINNKKSLAIGPFGEEYLPAFSGLGKANSNYLIIIPVFFNSNLKAVIELALFSMINNEHTDIFDKISNIISEKYNSNQE